MDVIELPDRARLTAAHAYGLDVLVDLSRLVPVASPSSVGGGDGPARSAAAEQADPGASARDRPTPVSLEVVYDDRLLDLAALRDGAAWSVRDGAVSIRAGALDLVTDLAGAGREQRATARDRHGRVPPAENPLVAAGMEREPVVSRAAESLRMAVGKAAGRRPVVISAPWPDDRRWAIGITHDVDVVDWWPAFTALRLAELLRGGHPGLAGRVIASAFRSLGGDPVWSGVSRVLTLERDAGLDATWFFLCGTPTLATARRGDLTYRPESRRARAILDAVRETGHEIGLHGSFATADSADAMRGEKERLRALSGVDVDGVRQHFLKMWPGRTQRLMHASGFRYDATYGFSSRNGFRLGVADVVPAWDESARRSLELDEVPLTWMDRALSKYAGVEDAQAWIADALELMETCATREGLWVGLWHPNLTAPLGFVGAEEALDALVERLRSMAPFVGTLGRIVAWRRARRGLRIEAISEGGDVLATVPRGTTERPSFDHVPGAARVRARIAVR